MKNHELPWIYDLNVEWTWVNLGDGSIHLELCFLKHFADPFLSQKSAGDWGCLTRIRCTEAMSFCAMPCLRSALRRRCILSQLRPKMMRWYMYIRIYIYICIYIYIYIYVYEVYLWGINMRICEVQYVWGICEVYMRCIWGVYVRRVYIYITFI